LSLSDLWYPSHLYLQQFLELREDLEGRARQPVLLVLWGHDHRLLLLHLWRPSRLYWPLFLPVP
jgi:hypothetical protein